MPRCYQRQPREILFRHTRNFSTDEVPLKRFKHSAVCWYLSSPMDSSRICSSFSVQRDCVPSHSFPVDDEIGSQAKHAGISDDAYFLSPVQVRVDFPRDL